MSTLAILGGTPVRSNPFPNWPIYDDSDKKVLSDVLESGSWAYHVQTNTFGSHTIEFSELFANYQGARYAHLVNNGSVALEISLIATGIEPGNEVIIPPITFLTTAAAVVRVGAIPIFVDVDPETFCLDPNLVLAAITPRTKAIIPVHLGCCMADMDALPSIAEANDLVLIEDCAHVAGAKWQGHGAGSIGDTGCFSFQMTKLLTCGEGGCLLTSNDHLDEKFHAIINCGRSRQTDCFEETVLGWNHRMTEFQAALLVTQFAKMELNTSKRGKNAKMIVKGISNLPWLEPVKLDPRITQRQYYYLTLRYNQDEFHDIPRDIFIQALNMEGIPTFYGYTPLYRDKLFVDLENRMVRNNPFQRSKLSYELIECPIAEKASKEEAINIFHSVLLGSDKDMEDILEAIYKINDNYQELLTFYKNRR